MILSNTPNLAVGILYFSHNFFVNIFDPSSCEATLSGPNTLMLFFFKSVRIHRSIAQMSLSIRKDKKNKENQMVLVDIC